MNPDNQPQQPGNGDEGKAGYYRKKPIVIEATQYLREQNISSVQDFVGKDLLYDPDKNDYAIATLEGVSYFLSKHDWIIKGINGEFYPCKPDIFEKTYESATQPIRGRDEKDKEIERLKNHLKEIVRLRAEATTTQELFPLLQYITKNLKEI